MRADLPTGTVTFLFTDVEGSTNLLQSLGAGPYAAALAEHRRVIRRACAARGGVEVDTQGDAFFFAFPTAPGALAASRAFTESLAPGPIHVRVGLHTGTPLVTDEGYIGHDVHRAARIAAVGHGGQVLVAASTATLVDVGELVDLGEHRFKDLTSPERIYQLGEQPFPALKTLYRSNLPIAANPLIGREQELAAVVEALLGGSRAVTITGPGGVGKTRFALAAAGEVAHAFPGGVWFVPLASLRDPSLVLPAVADAIGADGDVARHVGDSRCLLFLDNFEQVVEAAPSLATLARECPQLRLLVTSREALRIAVEREHPLPPLREAPSVELFRQRADAVAPQLEIDDATAGAICDRLDRLPLAIELAAARCKALSPKQILERLSESLDLLRGGRDADPRQQTLRATIEWSYGLLSDEEQRLFRTLSVFRGGCTLEAAEEVCGADLDALQSLVEKSLLRFTRERYWMLETIREYAASRLRGVGDDDAFGRAHAAYVLRFLEEKAAWQLIEMHLGELTSELDNFREAFEFALRREEPELALRLARLLAGIWLHRGLLQEAFDSLRGALELGCEERPELRAPILNRLSGICYKRGDLDAATTYAEESLALYEALGDQRGVSRSSNQLGLAAVLAGRYPLAREMFERALELDRRTHNEPDVVMDLSNLGYVALYEGDAARAAELSAEAAGLARGIDSRSVLGHSLINGAYAVAALGEYERGCALTIEAIEVFARLESDEGLVRALEALAATLSAAGRHGEARTVLASAERAADEVELHLEPYEAGARARALHASAIALDAHTLERCENAGRQMTLAEAANFARNAAASCAVA